MGPEPGIRSQHTVVAMAMDPRGRDELGEGLEELERGEQQLGAAVDVRLGEAVDQAALGRGKGGAGIECVQTFEREGRAGTVADESLDPGTVLGLDAHGGVDAEAARALPCEHAGGVELVEESLATEVAEDALLDDRLHVGDAVGRHVMGLVKLDLAVVGLAEDAVEDDEVVMRVDVEGGAEAMKARMKEMVIRLGRNLHVYLRYVATSPYRISSALRASVPRRNSGRGSSCSAGSPPPVG